MAVVGRGQFYALLHSTRKYSKRWPHADWSVWPNWRQTAGREWHNTCIRPRQPRVVLFPLRAMALTSAKPLLPLARLGSATVDNCRYKNVISFALRSSRSHTFSTVAYTQPLSQIIEKHVSHSQFANYSQLYMAIRCSTNTSLMQMTWKQKKRTAHATSKFKDTIMSILIRAKTRFILQTQFGIMWF